MRIIFLVIVNVSIERWKKQFELWVEMKRRFSEQYEIDVMLLECNKRGISCTESFSPGIFQKTVQGLSMVQNKYDLYIRTNLSTFFNIPVLFQFVESLKLDDRRPLYGGTYSFSWGVSGSGIFMNNLSVHLLLKHGFMRKYYMSSKPDDVVIGDIMKLERVSMDTRFPYMYMWENDSSFEQNMVVVSKSPYVRMKDAPIDVFRRLIQKT